MKLLVICAAILAALGGPAAGEIRYDRKLERAVMEIVARKMGGDLRGGFVYDARPAMVTVPDRMITGSIGIEMARSVVRASRTQAPADALLCKVTRIIAF